MLTGHKLGRAAIGSLSARFSEVRSRIYFTHPCPSEEGNRQSRHLGGTPKKNPLLGGVWGGSEYVTMFMTRPLRKRDYSRLAALLCVMAFGALPGWSQTLPFTDDFESYPAGTDLNGTNGWVTTTNNAAIVQTNVVYGSSTNACGFTNNSSPSVTLSRSFSDSAATNVVWVELYTRPRFCGSDPRFSADATAAFYVRTNSGYVVAYDGTNETILTNQPTVASNQWTRFVLGLDYPGKTWSLWLNGTNIVSNFDFYSGANTVFSKFGIVEGSSNTASYFDNINISTNEPSGLNVLSVNNASASNIRLNSATLNGLLATGSVSQVYIFWGTTDGGTNKSNWANTNNAGSVIGGTGFSADISGLSKGATYRYRCYATNAYGDDWADSTANFVTDNFGEWSYKMKITFSGYDKSGTLTNFPALVIFNESLPGFLYSQFAATNGGDLRFADSTETTELDYEIEQWATNTNSFVWVRAPTITGTNTSIWAYWGRTGETNPPPCVTNGATWSAPYRAVWHLTEGGVGVRYDSTSNNNDSVSLGSDPAGVGGKVDGANDFDGNDFVNYGDDDTLDPSNDAWSVEAWVKAVAPTGRQDIVGKQRQSGSWDGWTFRISQSANDRKLYVLLRSGASTNILVRGTGVLSSNTWHHAVMTYNGSQSASGVSLYLDGTADTANIEGDTLTAPVATAVNLHIGSGGDTGSVYFAGMVDEARLSNVALSSNWVWACWMNAASNDAFAGYGTVVKSAGGGTMFKFK